MCDYFTVYEMENLMNIRPALISDVNTVKNIAITTISEIYPHYYPMGAVEFFIDLHNAENIKADI